MSQIKKEVFGPLTANDSAEPGVSIVFPNGKTAAVILNELPPAIITRLAVHGLSQKLGDSYASAGKAENPLGFAIGRVEDVMTQLMAGDWRVTGGEAGPRVTLLARALARATGNSVEDAVAVIQDKADSLDEDAYKAWTKALNAQAAIKKAKAEIKLEDAQAAAAKAPTGGDADDLASLLS